MTDEFVWVIKTITGFQDFIYKTKDRKKAIYKLKSAMASENDMILGIGYEINGILSSPSWHYILDNEDPEQILKDKEKELR